MKEKIIFLDVDGVLNCEKTFQRHNDAVIGLDPMMCILLNRILEATDALVVLSSSWRGHKEGEEELEKFFPHMKFIFDRTVHLSSGIRGEEIREWLNKKVVPVGKYAILYDDSDVLPEQLPNFFKTEWKEGLTQEIADKVIAHLNS